MATTTKVSPKIRDRVPDGFFLDDKTWDLRLLQDCNVLQEALRAGEVSYPLRPAVKTIRTLPLPRRQSSNHGKSMRILLVEDNPGDVRLIQEALHDSKLRSELVVTENGVQALAYLHRKDGFTSARRPDLILLDLNLPLKDGREVLAEIKQDPDLRRIPVAVLTSSNAEHDIANTYDLHANCYIRKRMDMEQFATVVGLLHAFWFHVVQLPLH